MNPLRLVSKGLFDDRLNTDGPSHTFMRICTSRHVDDLQGIATFAFTAMIVMVAVVFSNPTLAKEQIALYSAILVTTAGVVSWAYQSASRRLGAVDLFASEVSAICRVCLIVEFAENSVRRAAATAPPDTPADATRTGDVAIAETTRASTEPKFTSAEEYTPVYDKNIADLQSLDFDVVKSVTNFYTYRKTMIDLMRRIAETPAPDQRRVLYMQMIYMQYLMYENGRHAVEYLIEFEPDKSECIINILCSEFVLYGFLKNHYGSEFRGQRLDLRLSEYERLYHEIRAGVATNKLPAWKKARTTTPELVRRYKVMRAGLGLSESP